MLTGEELLHVIQRGISCEMTNKGLTNQSENYKELSAVEILSTNFLVGFCYQ